MLYQCLVPNPREGLSLLVKHCSVPDDFERNILSGGIPRQCNQGILNYLLIILRRDKDFVKFWNIVKLLIDQPELRKAVERIQKSTCTVYVIQYAHMLYTHMCVCAYMHVCVCARACACMQVCLCEAL